MMRRDAAEDGAVLLMVLVALALLMAVAAAVSRLSAATLVSVKADGAIFAEQLVLPSLLSLVFAVQAGPQPLPTDGTWVRLDLPDRKVEVRLVAVAGLVNPNTAPRATLLAAFQAAGAAGPAADQLADRVVAARNRAAEAGQTRPFPMPMDLRLLLRDRPDLWRTLRGLITVLGSNVNLDPAAAPPALRALFPSMTAESFDLYGGLSAADSAAFYELSFRTVDPPRGGVTHAAIRFTGSGYQVVYLDWPEADVTRLDVAQKDAEIVP